MGPRSSAPRTLGEHVDITVGRLNQLGHEVAGERGPRSGVAEWAVADGDGYRLDLECMATLLFVSRVMSVIPIPLMILRSDDRESLQVFTPPPPPRPGRRGHIRDRRSHFSSMLSVRIVASMLACHA